MPSVLYDLEENEEGLLCQFLLAAVDPDPPYMPGERKLPIRHAHVLSLYTDFVRNGLFFCRSEYGGWKKDEKGKWIDAKLGKMLYYPGEH